MVSSAAQNRANAAGVGRIIAKRRRREIVWEWVHKWGIRMLAGIVAVALTSGFRSGGEGGRHCIAIRPPYVFDNNQLEIDALCKHPT